MSDEDKYDTRDELTDALDQARSLIMHVRKQYGIDQYLAGKQNIHQAEYTGALERWALEATEWLEAMAITEENAGRTIDSRLIQTLIDRCPVKPKGD